MVRAFCPDSGKILAVRTDNRRLFDLMWGLHIMGCSEREYTNSIWLFGFAFCIVADGNNGVSATDNPLALKASKPRLAFARL